MKIGIMGGTFNPIHIAHLILAERAFDELELDKILIMPSKNPPHKLHENIANDDHRVNMIKLAIEDNPHFEFSGMELERDGLTYTADTLEELTTIYPDNDYYFIVGADSLMQIEQWYKPDIILGLSQIIAFGRDHLPEQKVLDQVEHLTNKFKARIHFLSIPNMDISSKMIREMVNQKNSIRYYVPQLVIQYIIAHNLYQESI